MLRLWQKDGVYHARHVGTNNIVIKSDDWRDFSAQLKLRLDHEATLSEIHADAIKERRKSPF